MSVDATSLPVVLTLAKEPLLCARGVLSDATFAVKHEDSDHLDAADTAGSQALLRRCQDALAVHGAVSLTQSDVRLLRLAIQFVEHLWSLSDRQVIYGIDESDWELTVLLVNGAC